MNRRSATRLHRSLLSATFFWLWLCGTACHNLSAQDISFHNQIVPLLTRCGCNAGACHGAAAGRGGMHLSLLGSNPAEDYRTIVEQLEGRRIHRTVANKSLFLRKPTAELDHGGDQVFETDSSAYQLIRTWIDQGCKLDDPPPSRDFIVTAHELPGVTEPTYQLTVQVNRDTNVTSLTQLTLADPEAAELNLELAQVRLRRPGRHLVIARFQNHVKAITLTRPFSAPAIKTGFGANNFIDREINTTLSELNLPAGSPVHDAAFLRRATLDLTGRLPERQEAEAFLANFSPDKRQRAVDRLLASPAFNDYWTFLFSQWMRLHSLPNEPPAASAFGSWIRRSISEGADWRAMTQALLTSTGDSHQVGAANLSRMVGDARAHAELVGDLFLGARLGCANCHDHPLDRWTQEDYHGLAAMLSRIDRGRNVQFTSRGEVTNPKTSQPARWRLPGDRFVDEQSAPLETLSRWLTEPGQLRLSQSFTNRVWREMFHRGLVEAVNDMRDTNPATHPALLTELSRQVVQHDYDLRTLLRWIVNSETYARECVDRPDPFYSYHQSQPLAPHVFADAIAQVTDVPMQIDQMPIGARAVQLLDPLAPAPALDALGRCNRVAVCTSSNNASGLGTQLHLINGELINRTLIDPNGRLMRMLSAQKSTKEIVDEFHWRAFGEPMSAEQMQLWLQRLDTSNPQERIERLQDWLWSVLSSRKFQQGN